jgi:hypothetical protein
VLRSLGVGGLLASYLALAGEVSGSELLTGVLVAVLVAGWSAAIRHCSHARFAPTRAHLAHWGRGLAAVPPAALRIGARLLRIALCGAPGGAARAGRVLSRGFDFGYPRGAQARARRATALLIGSIGPESYVLRLAAVPHARSRRAARGREGQSYALLHSLGPAGQAIDREWLL